MYEPTHPHPHPRRPPPCHSWTNHVGTSWRRGAKFCILASPILGHHLVSSTKQVSLSSSWLGRRHCLRLLRKMFQELICQSDNWNINYLDMKPASIHTHTLTQTERGASIHMTWLLLMPYSQLVQIQNKWTNNQLFVSKNFFISDS